MTEQQLIDALHTGIHKANAVYEQWSGGLFLSEAAMEGFMVTYMAQAILSNS